jgi:hypothetical protein
MSTNPIWGMAKYSLMNALELYQKNDESHRFGAMILIDLSIEYTLKAKLYEVNPAKFIENQQELGFYEVIKDEHIKFVGDEETYLRRIHSARNFSQHRGSIASSLQTQEYMKWGCQFIKRFSSDNFDMNILYELPFELRGTWVKMTVEPEKISIQKFELKMPLEDNYRTVKMWIRSREKKRKQELSYNYKHQLLWQLEKYCKFLKKTPDEIVEEAKTGIYSPDESLKEFLEGFEVAMPYYIGIKNFYTTNQVKIQTSIPRYSPIYKTKEITTEQIRTIYTIAPDEFDKSWIIADSYLGLTVGKIVRLRVRDFHTENWNEPRLIYPVKIPSNVNRFDYTTFIGADAKEILCKYFTKNNFAQHDRPWKGNPTPLSWRFRTYALQAKIIGEDSVYSFTPKSFAKRIESILKRSGMQHEWVRYLLGLKPRWGEEVDRPMDREIEQAYAKAYEKLRIFEPKVLEQM